MGDGAEDEVTEGEDSVVDWAYFYWTDRGEKYISHNRFLSQFKLYGFLESLAVPRLWSCILSDNCSTHSLVAVAKTAFGGACN